MLLLWHLCIGGVTVAVQRDMVFSEEGPTRFPTRTHRLLIPCAECWDFDHCHMALVLWTGIMETV